MASCAQVHCALLRAVENKGLQAADAAVPDTASTVSPDSTAPLQWFERAAGAVLAAPEGWVSTDARVRSLGIQNITGCLHTLARASSTVLHCQACVMGPARLSVPVNSDCKTCCAGEAACLSLMQPFGITPTGRLQNVLWPGGDMMPVRKHQRL